MADDTDFVALYDELGLDAECSMADFKQAYRRRVAKLHPDLAGNPSDISRLQRLNRLYAAALDFEQVHGRLPGASRASRGQAHASTPLPAPDVVVPADPTPTPVPTLVAGSLQRWRYLLVLGLIALLLYWSSRPATSVSTFAQQTGSGAAQAPASVANRFVEIGMAAEQVREIQGEPFNFHEHHWEYGPSWIQFECRKVVGWYSSPLHPLQVRDANGASKGASAVGKPGRC